MIMSRRRRLPMGIEERPFPEGCGMVLKAP
jgi:hypothetical protein